MLQGTTTSTESSTVPTGDQSAVTAAASFLPLEAPGMDGVAWVVCTQKSRGKRRTVAHAYTAAHAQLFSAAPALLSALTELKADIEKLRWGQSYPGRNHALMDRVEAAIAKAEGR